MRLFIAVNLPLQSKQLIIRQVDSLKQKLPELKWVKMNNLHLTLKFLGEVDRVKIDYINNALTELFAARHRFPIHYRGIGAFPHLAKPRVIFSKVTAGRDHLIKLQQDLEDILADYFARDRQNYMPHLTLARSRKNLNLQQTALILKQFSQQDLINVELFADKISLIKSELRPEGPIYQEIFTVSLK